MKKENCFIRIAFFLLIITNLLLVKIDAQNVLKPINFQTILRGLDGNIMAHTTIIIQSTVLDEQSELYKEIRSLTTNDKGSFSFQLGIDYYMKTGNFEDIEWEHGDKFMKVDYDFSNSLDFDLTFGTVKFTNGNANYIDLSEARNKDVIIYDITTKSVKSKKTIEEKPESIITDIDENIYTTVKIANQLWMRENLKTTRYSDGRKINGCYSYNNDESNDADGYGKLYSWAAASDETSSNTNPSGVQGACPIGWHLPSHSEWIELERAICIKNGYLDCDKNFLYNETNTGYIGSNEGSSLKGIGDNKLPGCYYNTNKSSYLRDNYAFFWTSTDSDSTAWYYYLNFSDKRIARNKYSKSAGFSVKCLKD